MRVNVRGIFSSWAEVLIGVPQGSVLGPLLFLIFVNDLPDWVNCSIKMFADDTNIWAKISQMEDSESLQSDLNQLIQWSQQWLLQFHPDKCKVMHIGHALDTSYSVTDQGRSHSLQTVREEKDLGIYISDDLKPSLQCSKAASKAMSVLRLIRRTFSRIDVDDFKTLYHTYMFALTWNTVFKSGIHTFKRTSIAWRKYREGQRRWCGEWGLSKKGYTETPHTRPVLIRAAKTER